MNFRSSRRLVDNHTKFVAYRRRLYERRSVAQGCGCLWRNRVRDNALPREPGKGATLVGHPAATHRLLSAVRTATRKYLAADQVAPASVDEPEAPAIPYDVGSGVRPLIVRPRTTQGGPDE